VPILDNLDEYRRKVALARAWDFRALDDAGLLAAARLPESETAAASAGAESPRALKTRYPDGREAPENAFPSRAFLDGAPGCRASRARGSPYGAFPSRARRDGAFPSRARRDGAFPSRARRDGAFPSSALREGAFPSRARRDGAFPSRAADQRLLDPRNLALAGEALRRSLGVEAFEEQYIAALAMDDKAVAEMRTGEGKTLAAALCAAGVALRGLAVHIFTANDYLATRDAAWMGPAYALLGLSCAAIRAEDGPAARRAAYRCDILYTTSREAGFDYLRDGLAREAKDRLQNGFGMAIFDEADFILIDEARVPLVIAAADIIRRAGDAEEAGGRSESGGGVGGRSGGVGHGGVDGRDRRDGRSPGEGAAPLHEADQARRADALVRSLRPGIDFVVDAHGRKASLSLEGWARLEDAVEAQGRQEEGLFARVHAALHARFILRRDVDYLVKEGRLRPIDEFTGRTAEARRWPWGVQAALEVKEGIAPGREGRIWGQITVEHLAALYPKLGAMTATAKAAAEDFDLMYGLSTVIIPPRLPSRRVDHPDAVFASRGAAREALLAELLAAAKAGRPVLVGTETVRDSEELARDLATKGVAATVLNARNDAAEAAVIARAGEPGSVTVSTNMAGRGVDIRLGGPGEGEGFEARARLAAALGGLYVVGLGRRESRRVDEQLRGRAGRQGEPGETRFFVSLEDEFFQRYGVRDFLPKPWRGAEAEGGPVTGGNGGNGGNGGSDAVVDARVLREIDRAQSIIAQQNRLERQTLRKYGLLVEFDRRYVRWLRDEALVEGRLPGALEAALSAPGREGARPLALRRFVGSLDRAWAAHLALVEELREGAGLLRYGGQESGIEYAKRAAKAFEEAIEGVITGCLGDLEGPKEEEEEAAEMDGASDLWTYVMEEEELPAFSLLAAAPNDLGASLARAFALAAAAVAGLLPGREKRGGGA
jgi:preprotein translocase subunit SecA